MTICYSNPNRLRHQPTECQDRIKALSDIVLINLPHKHPFSKSLLEAILQYNKVISWEIQYLENREDRQKEPHPCNGEYRSKDDSSKSRCKLQQEIREFQEKCMLERGLKSSEFSAPILLRAKSPQTLHYQNKIHFIFFHVCFFPSKHMLQI